MANHRKMGRTLEVLAYIDDFCREHGFAPSIRQIEEALKFKTTSNVDYHLRILRETGCIDQESHQSRTLRVLPFGLESLSQLNRDAKPSGFKHDPLQQAAKPNGSASARKPGVRNVTYVNTAAHLSMTKRSQTLQVPVFGPIFAGKATEIQSSDWTVPAYDPETILNVNQDMLPARVSGSELFALEVHGESMIEAGIHDGDYVIVRQSPTAENGEMCVIWLDDTSETTLKYFFKEDGHIRLQPANSTMEPIIIERHRKMRVIGRVIQVVKL